MTLHEKIKYGYLHEALEEMLKLTQKTHFYEDCMMQSSAFHRIERDLEKGLITYQDANLTKNRINHALLSILEKYEREFGKIDSQNFDILTKNDNIVQNVKNKGNMGLQEFKDSLKDLVESCEMDTFFTEVEECPYEYNKSTYNSLKNSYLATSPLLNPCAMYSQQWKTFIGTLKEKK